MTNRSDNSLILSEADLISTIVRTAFSEYGKKMDVKYEAFVQEMRKALAQFSPTTLNKTQNRTEMGHLGSSSTQNQNLLPHLPPTTMGAKKSGVINLNYLKHNHHKGPNAWIIVVINTTLVLTYSIPIQWNNWGQFLSTD